MNQGKLCEQPLFSYKTAVEWQLKMSDVPEDASN